jgi:hypothetical protein
MSPIQIPDDINFAEMKRLLAEIAKRMNMVTQNGQIVTNDSSESNQMIFSEKNWIISIYVPTTE